MDLTIESFPRLAASELLFEGEPNRAKPIEKTLRDDIWRILSGKAELTPQTAASIQVFPDVCYLYGRSMLQHSALGPLLRESPFAALSAVYGEHSLAADLEPVIFRHGQTFLEYESWRLENEKPLHSTRERYERALLEDPFWGLRVVKVTKNAKDSKLLFEACEAKRNTYSHAAATWLMMTRGDGVREACEVLHRSPFSAYVGARFFSLHGFELQPEAVEDMTPQWACQFALLDPTHVPKPFYEVLLDCPAWMIEFLVRANVWHNPGVAAAEVNKSFARMRTQNNPPTRTYLAASPFLKIALGWLDALIHYANAEALPDLIKHGKRIPRPAKAINP